MIEQQSQNVRMRSVDTRAIEARFRKLPRWAIVAFAARCARRAQPVFDLGWPAAPRNYIEAIDHAIAIAEKNAATARAANSASRSYSIGCAAGVAALLTLFAALATFLTTVLLLVAHGNPNLLSLGGLVGLALIAFAFIAAYVAATVGDACIARDRLAAACAAAPVCARAAAAAAIAARKAAASVGFRKDGAVEASTASIEAHAALVSRYAVDNAIDAAKTDLELLEALAERERWTNKTRVPQSVFGDLWPNGPPERIHET